jgi:hypothetical protein
MTGLVLNGQIVDVDGTNVGSVISSGFAELGGGVYIHTFSPPDEEFQGGIKYFPQGSPSNIITGTAINRLSASDMAALWDMP